MYLIRIATIALVTSVICLLIIRLFHVKRTWIVLALALPIYVLIALLVDWGIGGTP